ncbi:MAG TPA: glycoside hydrolase domain-containing protein [Chryseosolibacter sp.]
MYQFIRPVCKQPSLLLLTVLLFQACAPEKGDSGTLRLAVLNSMQRIGQNEELFGDDRAVIKAARNETESFQVVVHALKRNAVVVNAAMSDLTGSAGVIKKENAALFREEYTRVRLSTPRAGLPPGLYADPLVPFIDPQTGKPIEPRSQSRPSPGSSVVTRGYEMYACPFEVWKGQNQPIWIDVSVPKDAAPGDYKGTFSIAVYDGAPGEIPKNDGVMFPGAPSGPQDRMTRNYTIAVTLTVWDFALPDGPTHRNNFGGVNRAANAFGVDPGSREFQEIELNYCRMMAENRINPPIPDSLWPPVNNDGSLQVVPGRTEALKKFIADLHVTDFPVPPAPFEQMLTVNREKAVRYYREFYRYLQDNGWHKRAYLYMLDEPNTKESYDEVVALGKLVEEGAPDLQRLVVEQPYPQDPSWADIDPAVDIWCPLFSFIDPDKINEKIARGDEVWSYTALAQRAPSYSPKYQEVSGYDPPYWAIDQPLTAYRMPAWIDRQYDINGYLYWTTDYSDRSVTGVMDPWFLPIYAASGKHFSGEGYLMYPGKPCGINGPVASLRLKNVRDGMEDYEYFAILEQLSSREQVKNLVSSIVPNWWAKPAPKDFLNVREKIAGEIVKLRNNPEALSKLSINRR